MKFEYSYLVLAIPILFFLLMTYEFWGEAPSLDPMVIYRESTQFFSGGVKEILTSGVTIHPPLIYLLNALGFLIFGKSPISYNIIGFFIYSLSLILLYQLTKKVFNLKMAVALILLIFCNPFIIANSFYLTNDMLILFGIILSLWGFLYSKKILFPIFLVLLTLMKETALLIILTFFIITFIEQISIRRILKNTVIFLPSVIILVIWTLYIRSLGTTEWRENYFIHTTDSSYLVTLKNIFQLKILNINLLQNLRNVFILNFQWIYLLILLVLLLFTKFREIFVSQIQKKLIIFLLLLSFLYIIFVFSFPTWTVPRYGIPVYLGLFSFLALSLSYSRFKNIYFPVLLMLLTISIASNLSSADPISSINGKIQIEGEDFYNIDFWNSGPDRIIYNLQYLKAIKKQNQMIRDTINKNSEIIISDCNSLKLGEKLWSISIHNEFYPKLKTKNIIKCTNLWEINKI